MEERGGVKEKTSFFTYSDMKMIASFCEKNMHVFKHTKLIYEQLHVIWRPVACYKGLKF